ncbi:hypothetical protein [Aestuariivita boseongensis]|uniref:hypothetical protein n=1 Tax=Aestuariivita boseongensis TaxID=1470562 RepID=UPI0006827503|nr:hypothetical protein [Aestuariivita boseongensis]
MRRTRAELAALLMKAVRGAGLPLALGEDLYAAAPYLSAEDVARIARDIAEGGTELTRLTLALDAAEMGEPVPDTTPLAQALAAARGWRLEDGRKSDTDPPQPAGPLEITDTLWVALDAYAARTYVPESEASRAKGAGAGAIDND